MQHSVYWSPGMKLESLEQHVILKAYAFYHKNKTATANSLGISIRTLDNKLEKYEMQAIEDEARNESRQRDREEQLNRARGVHPGQFDNAATPRFDTRPSFSDKTESRVRMESVANAAEKHAVPVSERQEVQEVLPRQATTSGANKKR